MRARITTFFLAAAAVASPVGAQDYTWRWDRADSYAPIGVQGDRVLSLGEFLISYRFQAQELDGIRLEETELGIDEVLDIFQSTPYNMTEQVHRVGHLVGDAVALREHQVGRGEETPSPPLTAELHDALAHPVEAEGHALAVLA